MTHETRYTRFISTNDTWKLKALALDSSHWSLFIFLHQYHFGFKKPFHCLWHWGSHLGSLPLSCTPGLLRGCFCLLCLVSRIESWEGGTMFRACLTISILLLVKEKELWREAGKWARQESERCQIFALGIQTQSNPVRTNNWVQLFTAIHYRAQREKEYRLQLSVSLWRHLLEQGGHLLLLPLTGKGI